MYKLWLQPRDVFVYNILNTFIVGVPACDHAGLKCARFASWLDLKHGLPHENIMQ